MKKYCEEVSKLKRPDIDNIKNMYNDAPIVFIQGARQAVPQLIEYIEQLEKDIKMFRKDTIDSIEKGKLRNIELDLITDKTKELVERNKALEKSLNNITKLRPIEEIHEDYGDVLLWDLESGNQPDIGSNLDCNFREDKYTHFSLIPPVELEGDTK
jgi:uncharacterized protein YydD (DUF2326 family)